MKKIEIIIESTYTKKILDILIKGGIGGYTVIKNIQGCGGHGLKSADDVSDIFSNNYIFTVCEEEKYLKVKESIISFIKKHGGKCIVSEAEILI